MSVSPESAAAALAYELHLPSWRGSVIVWDVAGSPCIVLAVDLDWLASAMPVPVSFMGFPVQISDRLKPYVGAAG